LPSSLADLSLRRHLPRRISLHIQNALDIRRNQIQQSSAFGSRMASLKVSESIHYDSKPNQ
jgi:hypothetical protein